MTTPSEKLTHGFALERELAIPELSATARLYRHAKTGGRLLSLVSPDENKVFGIALRTPPADHTGLPHILEHSVLCGSEKYPVKEPFVELIKGSLNTFLNALTFPDKTCYPVASANLQDFYNLVDVYIDAVFHPRLTENTLRQEGWHYDIESPDDELAIKGVVYNEMKGAYSSPDSLLSEYSQRALYPDTCYGVDSGGDPERIPDLTFAQFMDFHRRLYHPSNAYAFFSGDDDPDRRLEILDAAFSQYERLDPDSGVDVQAKFAEPRRFVHWYAAEEGADGEFEDDAESGEDSGEAPDGNAGPKAMCTVNFGLPQIVDLPSEAGADLSLALNVLEHCLIGLPSSPLRKALVDSGLGEDITGGGLETDLRQMSFAVGLKGMRAASAERDADAVQALVLSTLADLERQGLHADDVAAAINSVEFDLRENNTGSYPRGLALFFEALSTWLYDGDPLMLLPFEAPLARLKARLAGGERVFEALLREHFLDNPHRALVLLRPDTALAARREAEEKARLKAVKDALTPRQLQELVDQTHALRELQEAPDSPEDLAKIPRLTLADLPRENARIPQETRPLVAGGNAPLYVHELPTSGIVYLDLGLDLSAVPDRLLPLVPILGRALFEMGTEKTSFVDLTRKIATVTGGMWGQVFVSSVRDERGGCAPDPAARLFLRGKATAENLPALLDILAEVLTAPGLGDTAGNRERLAKIILESKARREQRLIPAGHTLAATRLKARYGAAQAMGEAMHGVAGFLALRELAARIQADPGSVLADLRELLALMLCRSTLVAGLTAEGPALSDAAARLERLVAGLPADLPAGAAPKAPRSIPQLPEREGLVLPAQVNYAAFGANLRQLAAQPGLASGVVCKFLRAGYLWERVRVQGGAYGAGVSYSRTSGNLVFSSYRDPNTARTIEAFQAIAPYLAGLEIDGAELEKSIIGTIGDLDHYMLPDAKGFTAMARELTGETEAYRQQVREAVLGASPADFADFGRSVAAAQGGCVVIAGGREALEQSGLDLTLTRLL